jgi:starch synthase
VTVKDGDGQATFAIHHGKLAELPIYLVDHPQLFRGRSPYGDQDGPYPDNWLRYGLFSRAVLESLLLLDFPAEVIHCLDWTAGLLPLFRELEYAEARPDHPAAQAGTFFGLHNLAMQGGFEREILGRLGIPHRFFQAVGGIELGGKVNFLKAGIEFATIIATHSPAHAEHIQQLGRGDGLEESFKRRKKELVGIQNGIDYRAWDPATDALLAQNFSKDDPDFTGKKKCKAAMQQLLRLQNGPRTPLVAIIGRFDSDSGFDVLAEALTPMLERNLQLVLMGPGRAEIMERLHTTEQTFEGRFRVIDRYNPANAHTILAGADAIVLPAHYHPSNALCAIAMRYGAVPIVYAHSGLEDTVRQSAVGKPTTGFLFPQYNHESLLEGIDAARALYTKPVDWKKLVRRVLEQDFSWQASAAEYQKAYRRVTRRTKSRKL